MTANVRLRRAATSQDSVLRRILGASWRPATPDPRLTDVELSQVIPLLLGSGVGALAWTRIRHGPLAATSGGARLADEYRFQTLRDAVRERDVVTAFRALSREGIDGVLIKGWSVARLYPDPAVRPHGDVDVWVPEEHFDHASVLAARLATNGVLLDIHTRLPELAVRSPAQILGGARRQKVGDVNIQLLAPEDELALLCLHFLRHGGWRPLWLVDVAVELEMRPAEFDWRLCLGAEPRRAGWILAALGLAHELLGASISGTPAAVGVRGTWPPRWLVGAVTRAWEAPFPALQPPMRHPVPFGVGLRHPATLIADLRARWPSPIEASIQVGAPCNRFPRLPYQLQYALQRSASWIKRH
jgi:hypothetical protein